MSVVAITQSVSSTVTANVLQIVADASFRVYDIDTKKADALL